MGTWLTPNSTPLPHIDYGSELDHDWYNGTSIGTEIRLEK